VPRIQIRRGDVGTTKLAQGIVELFGSFEVADMSRRGDHSELRIGDFLAIARARSREVDGNP